jgi:hypothetical protein
MFISAPSILNMGFDKALGTHTHADFFTESWADQFAKDYFGSSYVGNKDSRFSTLANKLYIPILALLFFSIEACDVMDNTKLKVYNNSRDTVFCFWTTESNFNIWKTSPLNDCINKETSLLEKNNYVLFQNDSSIFSNYDWEHEINSSKNKQLTLFFFKLKTLQERNWRELQEKVIYDKKIILTHEDLEKLNWKVVYDEK